MCESRDRLHFCVNVKEFLLISVTIENTKYFYVIAILQGGIGDPLYTAI